jgi:predicted Rdx family selenoprotein
MATEFWADFKEQVAITITPAHGGRLEVFLDGDNIFDRRAEDGKHPDLKRIRELRAVIKEKLE